MRLQGTDRLSDSLIKLQKDWPIMACTLYYSFSILEMRNLRDYCMEDRELNCTSLYMK